jgi:hypothetical protein
MVHVMCAARETYKGWAFEYGEQLNELPLDELVEDLCQEVVVTPLKLVRSQ